MTNISDAPAASGEAVGETTRFEQLLERTESVRTARLTFGELRELGALYRSHTARLAQLRQSGRDPAALHHLNALCLRAYSLLYAAAPATPRGRFAWLADVPAALAKTWRVQMLAWVLLLAGMVIGAGLMRRDPRAAHALIPSNMGYSAEAIDRLTSSAEERAKFFERGGKPLGQRVFFGSTLFVHNTRVGLLALATGMLAGIPTVLLQLYNGILLGAFSAIFLVDHWPLRFLAWILPHGVPELTAISLCSAAGLLLGQAVAIPGRRSRREAIRAAVAPALALFVTAIPLFILAAVIEGVVREASIGTALRLTVAGINVIAVAAWLGTIRRLARRQRIDTSWLAELR
jgi:uncharacterized membrane protein SpoIIM required for sporulation